jgi:hypothetical protein
MLRPTYQLAKDYTAIKGDFFASFFVRTKNEEIP